MAAPATAASGQKPTTPTSVAAGDDQFMQDHMYRLDALKLLSESGISHPSEQDIKAIAIKLRMKDEEKQATQEQQQQMAAAQAQAQQVAMNAQAPNLVAPQPAAGMVAPSGPAMAPPGAGGGPNIAQVLAALQQNGGPQ